MNAIEQIKSMFYDENNDIFKRLNELLWLIESIKNCGVYNYKRIDNTNCVSLVMPKVIVLVEYNFKCTSYSKLHYVHLQLLIDNILFSYNSADCSFPRKNHFKYCQLSDDYLVTVFDRIAAEPFKYIITFDKGCQEIPKPEK